MLGEGPVVSELPEVVMDNVVVGVPPLSPPLVDARLPEVFSVSPEPLDVAEPAPALTSPPLLHARVGSTASMLRRN